MPKAKVTEGPVGARVELIANLPLTIFGTVTAGDMGVTVETKVKRSSKHRRITYPYPEVVAFLEGAADEGAYVTVATTMDITEGTLLVEDADTITSEDGWMVIPQGNGAAVRVNEAVASDVKAIIHGDAFVKNGAAPTNGRRGPGRPKAATAAAADGTEPPKRRAWPSTEGRNRGTKGSGSGCGCGCGYGRWCSRCSSEEAWPSLEGGCCRPRGGSGSGKGSRRKGGEEGQEEGQEGQEGQGRVQLERLIFEPIFKAVKLDGARNLSRTVFFICNLGRR